jgi:microcystin-dependent protein
MEKRHLLCRIYAGASRAQGWQYLLQGQTGGQETVALQAAHLPPHNHGVVVASSPATSPRVGSAALNVLRQRRPTSTAPPLIWSQWKLA